MAVAREPELRGEGGQPGLGIGDALERGSQPQLVPVAVQREARAGAEHAAQVEARDADRACDLAHGEPLPEPRGEELLRLVDDLPVSRARRLSSLRAEAVEAPRRSRAMPTDSVMLSSTKSGSGLGSREVPHGEPLEEEHVGVARPEREREARQPREVEHELGRELDIVGAVAVAASQRAEEALSRVEEEHVVAIADDRLAPELADRHGGPREDHVGHRRNAVQPVPAAAFGRAPELSEDDPLVFEQGPVDRVCLHLFVQTSNRARSSNWHAEIVRDGLAIRLRGVVKRYGPITAVNGLDLDVPEGTCVGLLGPNGAGKSTTMRLLTAQAIADEGELEVLGFHLPEESKAARAECGVAPQLDNLDVTLTVEQNLLVFTHLYRIGRSERRAAIEAALEMANLADRRDTRVDKLSGGMRRRLLIARALVHRPRLVLLDEPTVGLDPQVRQELWALIDALRAEGTTILMSTHYIEEAERLADTVLIMSHGEGIAAGQPTELIAKHAGRAAVEVYGSPSQLAEAEAKARTDGFLTRRTGTSIAVLGVDGADGKAPEGERRPANLEDVFVLLTGEEID